MIIQETTWTVSGEQIDLAAGCLVGVINVTPDSFSDGGELADPNQAVERGLEMMAMGASLVDVGGESTRPGAVSVDEAEELRRLIPVVRGLVSAGVPVSVDTYKPGVARRAIAAGALVVNDITGFRDPEMVETVAGSDCGVVVMHMQGTPADMHVAPSYDDVVAEVKTHLLDSAARLQEAGVGAERIVIDPGLGFGKRPTHSLILLGRIEDLAATGYPVMVGSSRKGFLSKVVGNDDRAVLDRATAVTTALAFTRGARVFRVHDVARSRDALKVAGAIVTHQ